jgi:hypothetical protein
MQAFGAGVVANRTEELHMSTTRRYRSALAAGIAVLLVGTVGVAASTGAGGGSWRLGTKNVAHHTTTLVSDAGLDKATVKIKNKGDGAALSLVTGSDTPPMTVTSRAKVKGLNSDTLDGLDSSQLVRSDQGVDADTLDGKDSSAFAEVPKTPLTASVVSTEPTLVSDLSLSSLSNVVQRYDPSNMWWPLNGTNFKAPVSGSYVVSATITWAANSDGWRTVTIAQGGITVAQTSGPPTSAPQPTVQSVTGIVHLNQDSVVSVWASQSSGGGYLGASLTAFEMTYVGS